MNKDNVNQILDALAARLGTPAAHLWAVLMRQAQVEFWTQAVETALLWLLLIVAVRFVKARWVEWDELQVIAPIFVGILGLVTLIASAVAIEKVGYLINPEYYALREVLGAFK